jgi:iron complex outermembrane receptor protein
VPELLSYRLSGTWGIRDGVTKNRCAARSGQPVPTLVPPPCNQHVRQIRVVDPRVNAYVNNIDAFAARGQLLYTVPLQENSLEWLLNVHGGENNGNAYQYQHRGVRVHPTTEVPTNIGGNDAYNYRDKDGGDFFAGDYNVDGPEDISVWGANIRGTWLFGDDAYELQSLTAYEWNDRFTFENTDAGPKFGIETTYENSAWQWSQQLDLRGQIPESNFGDGDWTLGFYYLQEDLEVDNFFNQQGSADLFQNYTQELWNLAPYAQMEYRLQPGCEFISCDFSLLAGVRYNVEHKSFDTFVLANPGGDSPRPALVGEEDETWTGWSGELTLTWDFTEESSLYTKYSRGWKGGHFNGGATSTRDIITGVDPEIVDSYEAGLRSFMFDGRLHLDISAFYYDYQDLQVFIIEQTEVGFPISKLVNATDATVYGVELDLQTEPIPGLDINYHAAWVESEYDTFIVSFVEILRFPKPCRSCPPPPPVETFRNFDYSGNTLIASPRFSMTGSVEYDIPLPGQFAGGSLGTLSPRFSFSWKDSLLYDTCGGRGTRCNFEEEFFGQKPIWVFNAALTWRSENDAISVSGWVRNFLDEHYKTQSFDLSRGINLLLDAYADPRTYGVTATVSF